MGHKISSTQYNTLKRPSMAVEWALKGHIHRPRCTERAYSSQNTREKHPEAPGQSQTARLEAVHSSSRMSTQGAHFASQNA